VTLVLTGFMGAGKTTIARRLDPQAADADALLEQELGEPIASFFDREGESAFRAREEALVLRVLRGDGPRVLALGGGAVESPRVRDALRGHRVAWIDVDLETAWRRASATGERPLARDRDAFAARFAARRPLYEDLASIRVLTGPHEAWLGPLEDLPWPPDGLIEIPPGEASKTLETCSAVWRALVAQGATT
jgi:shikimate kinase